VYDKHYSLNEQTMAKRINVILPETTIRGIDRLVKPGERSRLINKALEHYLATRSAEGLREQLKQAAIRDRDLVEREISDDWAAVDHESWQQMDREGERKAPGRAAAKSTSRRSTRR
jgi:CopG family transcriptional regulator/antitoxin EndoAI